MSEEDTTQFTVHAAPEETRRQPMENTEEYGDRILAQFATMDEESPFFPRSRLQRMPVITSTPIEMGRQSPEGLNLGRALSPVRETGTATTEQRYEAFRTEAEGRGERTLGELRGHIERLQREREEKAERQRLLQEQRELEQELEFERERQEQEEFQRRQAEIARNMERQRRQAEQMEAELAALEEQQQMQQRLQELERRQAQLRASVQLSTTTRTSPVPTPASVRHTSLEPTIPASQLLNSRPTVRVSLPHADPSRIPAVSTIETAYRRTDPAAVGKDAIEFNQALK